jgi:hypothetical protein
VQVAAVEVFTLAQMEQAATVVVELVEATLV